MRLKHFCIALSLAVCFAPSAGKGAVQLSSLTTPSLQTLIAMGSTPVVVGPYQFNNFGFIDDSTGSTYSSSQIQVQAFSANGYGLRFVANWFAANGSMVDDVITYDVQATSSSQPITQINLLSNGTAPVPVTGTFATSTLLCSLPGGSTAAPELSTYNDGITTPIDTTKPDVNFADVTLSPQLQLSIIDTLFAISTPAGSNTSGGVATASVLQNSFVPVSIPEPTMPIWILVPLASVFGTSGRQHQRR